MRHSGGPARWGGSVELVELVLREAREGGGRSDTSLAREIDTFLATHRPREQGD